MPPTGGRRDGQKKKNPLWALLTGCTSCKSAKDTGEVTIEDAPGRNAPGERKKTKGRRSKKQKATGGDTSSIASWDTVASSEVDVIPSTGLPSLPGSSVDLVTQSSLGNSTQPNGTAPLGRVVQQSDVSVQTDEITPSGKENIRDGYKAKRKQRLSPRQQRRSDKQDSDQEGYSSDASDGKSSPKRRRRRKYSDIVRVERLFIEKNTHTKEEVVLDKLRRKKIKARRANSGDESDSIEINNYDSEGEVPINRSHRLGSMRSLNNTDISTKPITDKSSVDNTNKSEKKMRNKSTDPSSRLILQHIHFNQYVTKETEVVKYLPATETMNVDGETNVPLLVSGDISESTVDGTARPPVTSTQPNSTDQAAADSEHQGKGRVTESSEEIGDVYKTDVTCTSSSEIRGEQAKIEDLDTYTEPIVIPGEVPTDIFPEENNFAKVERSPTLERKYVGLITETMDIDNDDISYSNNSKEPGDVIRVVDIRDPLNDMVSSKDPPQKEIRVCTPFSGAPETRSSEESHENGQDYNFQGAEKDNLHKLSLLDITPNRTEQSQDVQEFTPAVVTCIESNGKREYVEQCQKDLPDVLQIVPGGIGQPTELLSGMTTPTPAVLKAGCVDVTNNVNLVDQQSVGSECDMIGYDSFKAGLEAGNDLAGYSSQDNVVSSSSDNEFNSEAMSAGDRNIARVKPHSAENTENTDMKTSTPSKVLINSETQTDEGYCSEHQSYKLAQSPDSTDSATLERFMGERIVNKGTNIQAYNIHGTDVSSKLSVDIKENTVPHYPMSDCTEGIEINYPSQDSSNIVSDLAGFSVETQTNVLTFQTDETQTLQTEVIDASTGSDARLENIAAKHNIIQNELDFQTNQTQTLQAKFTDASTGSDAEMKDVILSTTETQTHELRVQANETQTVVTKFTDASTGSDAEVTQQKTIEAPTSLQTNETQTNETQTAKIEFADASTGSEIKTEDVTGIQNVLGFQTNETQTMPVMVSDVLPASVPERRDVVLITSETQTPELTIQTTESQTGKIKVSDASTGSDVVPTQQNTAETQTKEFNLQVNETQTVKVGVTDASTNSEVVGDITKNDQIAAGTQTQVMHLQAHETQTVPTEVMDVSSGSDVEFIDFDFAIQTTSEGQTHRNKLNMQSNETQTKQTDVMDAASGSDAEDISTTEISCQTEFFKVDDPTDLNRTPFLDTSDEELKPKTMKDEATESSCQTDHPASMKNGQAVETQTPTTQVDYTDGLLPKIITSDKHTETIIMAEDISCQTEEIDNGKANLQTTITQTVHKEVTDAGTEMDMNFEPSGNNMETKSEISCQTEKLIDVTYGQVIENVLTSEKTSASKIEVLPIISYENIPFKTPIATWTLKESESSHTSTQGKSQGVSFGCQVDEVNIGSGNIDAISYTKSRSLVDEVFKSESDSSDREEKIKANVPVEQVKRRRKLNLQITKLDQISIDPDLSHQVVPKNVTFLDPTEQSLDQVSKGINVGEFRLPFKTEELRVDTSPGDLFKCTEAEQTSPLSVSSEPITCSSSREYSPDNDRSFPSEDETPLSPLPLDETPDSGFAESPNFVYKKARISSVDQSDLEISADRLSPVVESFPETESAQEWQGSISLREDRYTLKERRQGVSTLSGDYSSTDDNMKHYIEERKKPVPLKRTGSSSPRRGRRTSPMRPRRYISSDESSEEEEEEEAVATEYNEPPVIRQTQVGKSSSLASTPSKVTRRHDHATESDGKYQWPQHGPFGDFSGDMDDSYHKELRTDGSSTPSGYGSMADDTASTDGSILDRSDDNVLDKHMNILNESQIAWHLPRHSPAGQPMAPRMVFTTEDGTEILVRSPADGPLSPANVKSPRTLTPREQETLFKDIPYEKLDTMVQKVLMAYIDRCGLLETKMSEVQKERDGLAEDNHSLYEKTEQLNRRMSLMEIEIEVMRKELAYHATYRTVVSVETRHYSRIPMVGVYRTRTYPRM